MLLFDPESEALKSGVLGLWPSLGKELLMYPPKCILLNSSSAFEEKLEKKIIRCVVLKEGDSMTEV